MRSQRSVIPLPTRDISVKSFEALPSGALKIRGIGANYREDRDGEMFSPGAFEAGLREFMLRPSRPLLWHHSPNKVLGKVISAEIVEGVGVVIEAIVNYQERTSPLRPLYDAIKAGGSAASLSVGGFFTREGNKIVKCEPVEWSITPISSGRGTDYEVVEGKSAVTASDVQALREDVELAALRAQVATMRDTIAQHATPDPGFKAVTRPAPTPERLTLVGSGSAHGFGVVSERPTLDALQSAEREASWAKHRDAVEAKYQRACTEAREAGLPEPWRPMGALPLAAPFWWGRTEGEQTVRDLSERVALEPGVVETPKNQDAFGRTIQPPVELSPEQQFALDAANAADRPKLREKFKDAVRALTTAKRDVEPEWEIPDGSPVVVNAHEKSPEQVFAEIARNEAALAAEGIDYE